MPCYWSKTTLWIAVNPVTLHVLIRPAHFMAVVSIQSSRWANTVAINIMVATGKTENKNIRVYSSMFEMTGCISKQTHRVEL